MSESSPIVLCPYCGHLGRQRSRCEACKGLFEPLSQKATQIAMGPWFVRDARQPFRPGCSYEVIKRQITAGRLTSNSILRGPTTRQFWSLARNVPGVAHLLGFCHHCHSRVLPTDTVCKVCSSRFGEVSARDQLGLRYPTADAANEAQGELQAQMARIQAGETGHDLPRDAAHADAGAGGTTDDALPGIDLLDQILATSINRANDSTDRIPPSADRSHDSAFGAASPDAERPKGAPPEASSSSAGPASTATSPSADAGRQVTAIRFDPVDDGEATWDVAVPTRRWSANVWILASLAAVTLIINAILVVMLMQNGRDAPPPPDAPANTAAPAPAGAPDPQPADPGAPPGSP